MSHQDFSKTNSVPLATSKPNFLPYVICLLGAMFYLYEFVLQVSPAVMTSELMRDFQLNAAGLGAMAAFYYYSYTPMQLPAGLLYDRFGTRILITVAIGICTLGAFCFSLTHSVAIASFGRLLMGVGSAFSFIGAILLVSRWLPPQYFALMAGVIQLMSSVGAIAGQAPLAAAIATWGWRSTLFTVAVLGLLLGVFTWFLLKEKNPPAHNNKAHVATNEWQRLRKVCGNSQTWWIALFSFMAWAPIVAFAALWGIPFLVVAYGISTKVASTACAMIWVGIGVGSPFIGWWSDKIGRRCLPLTLTAFLGFIAAAITIYFTHLNIVWLYICLFFIGVGAAGQALSFGLVRDRSDSSIVGTAVGFNNMAVVAGGALFQPLIGILLHWHSTGEMQQGAPVYNLADYQIALILVPLCYLAAALISRFLIKETHCLPQYHATSSPHA